MKYKNIVIAIGFLLAFSIKQDLKGQSHLSINSASTMAFSKASKAPDSEKPQLTILKGGGIFQSLNTSMIGGSIGLERTFGRKWSIAMDINYAKGSSDEVRIASVSGVTFTVPWAYIEKTWHFDPFLRFYPRKAGNGFFLGLGLGLMNYSDNSLTIVTNTREFYTSTQTQVAFVPKLATGLNLKLSDVLFLDINGGLGVPLGEDIEVFLISASFRIGYRF